MATGQSATVESVRKDGRVVVRAGAAKLTVDAGTLEKLSGSEKRKEKRKQSIYASAHELVSPSAPSEVDLRGMTGDEAQAVVEQAVDAAVLGEKPLLRIIHGMGMITMQASTNTSVRHSTLKPVPWKTTTRRVPVSLLHIQRIQAVVTHAQPTMVMRETYISTNQPM